MLVETVLVIADLCVTPPPLHAAASIVVLSLLFNTNAFQHDSLCPGPATVLDLWYVDTDIGED